MRHLKQRNIGLLFFLFCSLALSGCSGSIVEKTLATGTLTVSSSTVNFGQVAVGKTASTSITLSNAGSAPVEITELNLSGQPFSVSDQSSVPITVGASKSLTFTVQFEPTASGSTTGQLTIASNASNAASAAVTLSGTGVPVPTNLTCASGSITGAATDDCTVTLNAAAGSGGTSVSVTSNTGAVAAPATVTVSAGATSAEFTVNVSPVTSIESAVLTASVEGVDETFALQLGASAPILGLSASKLTFGNVAVNAAASQSVVLSSTGTQNVTVSAAVVSGSGFSISGEGFPVTLAPGQTATLSVEFNPTVAGATSGQLTVTSNSSAGTSSSISLNGTGVPVLNALSCTSGSLTGAGTDSCTVTLNAAAASGGFAVSLASNNSAVAVPASVTVAAGSTTASFTATVSSVSSSQTVTLTASANSVAKTFALQLGAALPVLNALSCTSGSLTGAGTDSCTVTLSGAAPSGGFAVSLASNNSAVALPASVTVAAGSTTASFTATVSSVSSSQTVTLTASANSVTETFALQLGAGVPTLNALSCTSGSLTGAGTDSCTVTLSGAAPSGGLTVSLTSNNSAVTVPASVTVAAGSTTASFTATVASVSSSETVTLTASANSVAKTFALQLGAGVPTLTVAATVAFGNVDLNTPATQSLVLSSTGTAAVTISAETLTGTGFTASGVTFPLTLNPNQTATLSVEFDPTTAGAESGHITLTSNSSTGVSTTVILTGTGVSAAYEVILNWDAPTTSTDPVAGYNVYRSPSGANSYTQINTTVVTSTTYTDTTVQDGQNYDYMVESVDASNITSTPSNTTTADIP